MPTHPTAPEATPRRTVDVRALRRAGALAVALAASMLGGPVAPGQDTSPRYAYAFGGTAVGRMYDQGVGVGTDGAGNAYVLGSFQGAIDVDPGAGTTLLVSQRQDVYVASFDLDGGLRFAFRIGNGFATSEEAGGIAVDEAGGFVVTGRQPFGSIDYDPDPASVAERTGELFVAAYDAGGAFRFAVVPDGARNESSGKGNAVALDAAGHVYVTGRFSTALDFDPDPARSDSLRSAGNVDVFVASYDAHGAYRFGYRLGGPGYDEGHGLAVAPAGHLYVVGRFSDTVAFDPDDRDGDGDRAERTARGDADLFLASYTAEGRLRFAHAVGSPESDWGAAVALDASANVYVTGRISGTVAFDPDDRDGDGDREERAAEDAGSALLASYTSDGRFRFATVVAGGSSEGRALVTEPTGTSVVTGGFAGTVDFSPAPALDTLAAGEGRDTFVASYDAAGAHVKRFALGGTGSHIGLGLALDSARDLVLTGTFSGTSDFDPGPDTLALVGAGQTDAFVGKYPGSLAVDLEEGGAAADPSRRVGAAYPNPFRQRTRLPLRLSRAEAVRVTLVDALGREVRVLHDGVLAAGRHEVAVAAAGLPGGLYVVRVAAASFAESRRVVLLR